MKFLISLFIVISLIGCKRKNKPQETTTPFDSISEKASLYLQLGNAIHPNGSEAGDDCDGLLWNSLWSVTGGNVDIMSYQGELGQWFRTHHHTCFYRDALGGPVDNGSKSTISRDMFLGLLHWIWHNQRKDVLQDIINYGREQNPKWWMGDAVDFIQRESRTHIRTNLRATMYIMAYKMGIEDNVQRHIDLSLTWSSKVDDFKLHLSVQHLLLRGLMQGVNDIEVLFLEKVIGKHPTNAFFLSVYHYFTDGNQTKTVELLLDDSLFPAKKLPTSFDRCERFIYQRNDNRGLPENKNWNPCDDNKTFMGIDLLWTHAIISGRLRNK